MACLAAHVAGGDSPHGASACAGYGSLIIELGKSLSVSSKTSDEGQIDRFKEAARALGCNQDEAAFDEKLKAIAKQKAKEVPQPKSK